MRFATALAWLIIPWMAISTTVRGWDTLTLLYGASCLLFALWDLSDEAFGATRGGALGAASAGLFHLFGHWGPRVTLIAIGLVFVASSFRLAALAKEQAGSVEPQGTTTFALLSWTLVVLVLSLLAFIVVGPLLHKPAIDGVVAYWQERYYRPVTTFTAVFVLGLVLRLTWREFRATGDPWQLVRVLMYLMLAISLIAVSMWEAVFGGD